MTGKDCDGTGKSRTIGVSYDFGTSLETLYWVTSLRTTGSPVRTVVEVLDDEGHGRVLYVCGEKSCDHTQTLIKMRVDGGEDRVHEDLPVLKGDEVEIRKLSQNVFSLCESLINTFLPPYPPPLEGEQV